MVPADSSSAWWALFQGLGFRVLGFRVLGFRVLGFRVLGFRVLGFRGLGVELLYFKERVLSHSPDYRHR